MKTLFSVLLLLVAGGLQHVSLAGEAKVEVARTEDPGAAKLWAQTCSRCHNLRPANSFSDAQWDVIVHHMRVRANLTGGEARRIAAYLKEANHADNAAKPEGK